MQGPAMPAPPSTTSAQGLSAGRVDGRRRVPRDLCLSRPGSAARDRSGLRAPLIRAGRPWSIVPRDRSPRRRTSSSSSATAEDPARPARRVRVTPSQREPRWDLPGMRPPGTNRGTATPRSARIIAVAKSADRTEGHQPWQKVRVEMDSSTLLLSPWPRTARPRRRQPREGFDPHRGKLVGIGAWATSFDREQNRVEARVSREVPGAWSRTAPVSIVMKPPCLRNGRPES